MDAIMKTRVLPVAFAAFSFSIILHAPRAQGQTLLSGSSGLAPLPPMAPPSATLLPGPSGLRPMAPSTTTSLGNPEMAATRQLTMGVWHFAGAKWSNDVVFNRDGTLTILNARGAGQIHWKIAGNKVVIAFGPHKLALLLPLAPGGTTKGEDSSGQLFAATWSNGPTPIAAATPPPSRTSRTQQQPAAPSAPASQGSSASGQSYFGSTQERTTTTQDIPGSPAQ